MSIHKVKILELQSFHEVSGCRFLRLNVSFSNERSVLYWLVDEETSDALKEICSFQGFERYRLSMNATCDQRSGQHASSVTKTYRDTSKRMDFRCSFKYHEQLEKIKHCQSIEDLLALDFIFPNLPKEESISAIEHDLQKNGDSPSSFSENPETILENSSESNGSEESNEEKNETGSGQGQQQEQSEFPVAQVQMEEESNGQNGDSESDFEKKQETEHKKAASFFSTFPFKKRLHPALKGLPQHFVNISLLCAILIILFIFIFDFFYDSDTGKSETHQVQQTDSRRSEELKQAAPSKDETEIAIGKSTIPSYSIEEFLTFSIPEGYVALTFDDGPSKYTKTIVDILKKHEVGGTFFFIGYNVQKHPELVNYVHSHGFSIGSHSMTHTPMNKQSLEEQQYEIRESKKLLEEIIGEPVKLFRPPYGLFNEQTQSIAENEQCQMVLWNSDPRDRDTEDPNEIIEKIKSENPSSKIITLHESQQLVEALPEIIIYLKQHNLHIVSLY